jgi:hypothetical protein
MEELRELDINREQTFKIIIGIGVIGFVGLVTLIFINK